MDISGAHGHISGHHESRMQGSNGIDDAPRSAEILGDSSIDFDTSLSDRLRIDHRLDKSFAFRNTRQARVIVFQYLALRKVGAQRSLSGVAGPHISCIVCYVSRGPMCIRCVATAGREFVRTLMKWRQARHFYFSSPLTHLRKAPT